MLTWTRKADSGELVGKAGPYQVVSVSYNAVDGVRTGLRYVGSFQFFASRAHHKAATEDEVREWADSQFEQCLKKAGLQSIPTAEGR